MVGIGISLTLPEYKCCHFTRYRSDPYGNHLVYEARELLMEWGWLPVRLCEPTIPLNLIAMKGPDSLLILVVRSRNPVPSAAVLTELCPGLVHDIMALVGTLRHRIVVRVHSPQCGWRYYTVYPGGLMYDPTLPKALGK
jgi:hypothetical protein